MMAGTAFAARRLGFSREDEIAIVFCGSKKSLVTGIPMANALFAGTSLGLVVLPLMICSPIAAHGLCHSCAALCAGSVCARRGGGKGSPSLTRDQTGHAGRVGGKAGRIE